MKRAWIAVWISVAGCAGEYPPAQLSEWGLFEDGAQQVPVEGVVPYELISPLFSDYAAKHRFIRLPEGGRITYTDDGDWVFPIGTVIVKTFGFLHDLRDPAAGERIVETRLLVREDDGAWRPYVYLWDADERDARLTQAGARVPVEWTHHDGASRTLEYRVPNSVQCGTCHGGDEPSSPIGPRTEQLDRDYDYGAGPENQIDHFASLGWFDGAVPASADRPRFVDPFGTGSLEARARGYLDANCAHCHREGGAAGQSGLWLSASITQETPLGICKRPVAAGRGAGMRAFDIVPGSPEASVITYRMASEEPGVKMPELPGLLSHPEGVELIEAWIRAMPARTCNE